MKGWPLCGNLYPWLDARYCRCEHPLGHGGKHAQGAFAWERSGVRCRCGSGQEAVDGQCIRCTPEVEEQERLLEERYGREYGVGPGREDVGEA